MLLYICRKYAIFEESIEMSGSMPCVSIFRNVVMKTVKFVTVFLALLPSVYTLGQTTIEDCVEVACQNYP